jgi:hypothetical protein
MELWPMDGMIIIAGTMNAGTMRRIGGWIGWCDGSGMGKPYMSLRPSRRPQPSRCSQGWGLNPSGRPRLLRGARRNS